MFRSAKSKGLSSLSQCAITEQAQIDPLLVRLTKEEYLHIAEDLSGSSNNVSSSFKSRIDKIKRNDFTEPYKNNSPIEIYASLDLDIIEISERFASLVLNSEYYTQSLLPACQSSMDGCISYLSQYLIPRIWRKVVTDAEQAELLRYVANFESADRMAQLFKRIFTSPYFHFKRLNNAKSISQSHFEVAERIAFLTSGSIPDEKLIKDALNGRIAEESTQRSHIKRLLGIPQNLERFALMFATQWMGTLDFFSDSKEFKNVPLPDLAREVQLLILFILHNDLNIEAILTPPRTYTNNALNGFYNINGGSSEYESRQLASSDSLFNRAFFLQKSFIQRDGVDESNFVKRGKFILDKLVCKKLEFPGAAEQGEIDDALNSLPIGLNFAEKMEQLRKVDACKRCHKSIDPPGLALEQIGPFGGWRDNYQNGSSIKIGSEAFGIQFQDSNDFINQLSKSEQFRSCFIQHLKSYASSANPFAKSDCTSGLVKSTATQGALSTVIEVLSDEIN